MRRVREKRKVLSSSLFIKAIEEAKDELCKQEEFLRMGINNPSLIFDQANKLLGKRGLAFDVMNRNLADGGKVQVHDFQTSLADLTNQFVQYWAKEHGIEEDITVEVRTPNTFPSLFAIYFGECEVMQFSITEKIYGNHRQAKTEETIREEYAQLEKNKEDERKSLESKITEYEEMLKDTHGYVRNFYRERKKGLKFFNKRRFSMLKNQVGEHISFFFKKQKLESAIQDKIDNLQKHREVLGGRYEIGMTLEESLSIERLRSDLFIKFTPMFEEFEYTHIHDRHRLY